MKRKQTKAEAGIPASILISGTVCALLAIAGYALSDASGGQGDWTEWPAAYAAAGFLGAFLWVWIAQGIGKKFLCRPWDFDEV